MFGLIFFSVMFCLHPENAIWCLAFFASALVCGVTFGLNLVRKMFFPVPGIDYK